MARYVVASGEGLAISVDSITEHDIDCAAPTWLGSGHSWTLGLTLVRGGAHVIVLVLVLVVVGGWVEGS